MINLLSYCGLVDAKIRASDKDLPVSRSVIITIVMDCISQTPLRTRRKSNKTKMGQIQVSTYYWNFTLSLYIKNFACIEALDL